MSTVSRVMQNMYKIFSKGIMCKNFLSEFEEREHNVLNVYKFADNGNGYKSIALSTISLVHNYPLSTGFRG